MHEVVEHYGKVIVALGAAAAAVIIVAGVVVIVRNKTVSSVNKIDYESQINQALNEGLQDENNNGGN